MRGLAKQQFSGELNYNELIMTLQPQGNDPLKMDY